MDVPWRRPAAASRVETPSGSAYALFHATLTYSENAPVQVWIVSGTGY